MNIHEQAINKFGRDSQMLKAIEEMAELTKEFSKYLNTSLKLDIAKLRQLEYNICDEIADVQITLDQIKLLFPAWKLREEKKLERLKELVKEKV